MSRYNRCIMPEYVEEKEDVSGNADESWQVGQPFNPPKSFLYIFRVE